MKKRGFTLIELLVVIAIIAMLLAILMPALNKVKKIAQRVVCGTNLKGLGTAQVVYANDYEDSYAVQSASGSPTWGVATGGFANSAKDWSIAPSLTVGASLYLLVREADVSPKSFVCGAGGQTAYEGENGAQADITELWDFGVYGTGNIVGTGGDNGLNGHGPRTHVSYSYQMPYAAGGGPGRHAADGTKSAAFAVMSDKNPWMDPKISDSVAGVATADNWVDCVQRIAFYWNNPAAPKWKIQVGNSYPHSREGQNVLFGDGHSSYEKVSDVGVKHDNIYTINDPSNTEEARVRRGIDMDGMTIDGAYQPDTSNDSFLVNDDTRDGLAYP